jgi:hypothetical protein
MVKTSDAAALTATVASLTLELDSITKSQTARVSATSAYQKVKSEAAALLKQSKVLEACLSQAQQEHQDSQRTCAAQQQELAKLQDQLQAERSAHLLTAQREEQAATALAAEHQRLSSGTAALMSAQQGLQASHAEVSLLREQLAEADNAAAELQTTVARLQQKLSCACVLLHQQCQASACVRLFTVAAGYMSALLAAHNNLQQQLAGAAHMMQQLDPAAADAASVFSAMRKAAQHCGDGPDVELEGAAATKLSAPCSTSSALLAEQQGLQGSSTGPTDAHSQHCTAVLTRPQEQQQQHVPAATTAARRPAGTHSKAAPQGNTAFAASQKQQHTAVHQQGLTHRKPPRCKNTQRQLYASTPLQQQLSNCQALLQKQSEAAAVATAKASAAEWRSVKLSAECGRLQQQHVADAGTISALQKQLQQLQGQLVLLQDAAARSDQLPTLLLPQPAAAVISHLSTASQHNRPQYVPPEGDAAGDMWRWPSAAPVHVRVPDQAAITAVLQPEVSHGQDLHFDPELAVQPQAAVPVQLSRQWGSGLCEVGCSDVDDVGSNKTSSTTDPGSNTSSSGSSNCSRGSSEQGREHPKGGIMASVAGQPGGLVGVRDSTEGGLQAVDDSKDSFYTAVEVLSDSGDE